MYGTQTDRQTDRQTDSHRQTAWSLQWVSEWVTWLQVRQIERKKEWFFSLDRHHPSRSAVSFSFHFISFFSSLLVVGRSSVRCPNVDSILCVRETETENKMNLWLVSLFPLFNSCTTTAGVLIYIRKAIKAKIVAEGSNLQKKERRGLQKRWRCEMENPTESHCPTETFERESDKRMEKSLRKKLNQFGTVIALSNHTLNPGKNIQNSPHRIYLFSATFLRARSFLHFILSFCTLIFWRFISKRERERNWTT